ncbi:MAG: histidine kinase [Bacteroidales bacterium]
MNKSVHYRAFFFLIYLLLNYYSAASQDFNDNKLPKLIFDSSFTYNPPRWYSGGSYGYNLSTKTWWYTSSDFYYNVPTYIYLKSNVIQHNTVTTSHSEVEKLNDTIFSLRPGKLGNIEIGINGHNYPSRVITLPDPWFFWFHGLESQPIMPLYRFPEEIVGITIDVLKSHNQIEGRMRHYIYPVKNFFYSIEDGNTLIAREFSSTNIVDVSQIETALIGRKKVILKIEIPTVLAPDSSERTIGSRLYTIRVYSDSASMLVDKYFIDNLTEIKIAKSNIRIRIQGKPTEEDIKFLKNQISQINPHLSTIRIKLVDNSPSLVIVYSEKPRESKRTYNLFFPTIYVDSLFLDTKMGQFSRNNSVRHMLFETLGVSNYEYVVRKDLAYVYGKQGNIMCSREESIVLSSVFSSDGESVLRELKGLPPVSPDFSIVVCLLIGLFLLFITMEVYHFYNLTIFFRSPIIRTALCGLIVSQLAILSFILYQSIFVKGQDMEPHILIKMEMYFSTFGVLSIFFFYLIDKLVVKVRSNWLRLIINPILSGLSLFLSYLVIYLFVRSEWLKWITIDVNALTIGFAIILVRFYLQLEDNKISGLLMEKELELVKQKELKNRAELNALHARINPHFLYNSLNSIASLAMIDASRTEKMALALSKLFRYNVNRQSELFSTIREELEMVQIYLEIEKERFGEKLNFFLSADESVQDKRIPRFIIQPLVENSIKHGISRVVGVGIIKVNVTEERGNLIIEVHDNGPGFPDDLLTGYGLQNICDKIELLSKRPYSINFNNGDDKHIRLEIM